VADEGAVCRVDQGGEEAGDEEEERQAEDMDDPEGRGLEVVPTAAEAGQSQRMSGQDQDIVRARRASRRRRRSPLWLILPWRSKSRR
jgi:hypothetical protein